MPSITDTTDLCKAIHNVPDRSGIPYYEHPIAVKEIARELAQDYKITSVTLLDAIDHISLLHDSVEDTFLTVQTLHGLGYSDTVCLAVHLLTHPEGVSYDDYISRIIAGGLIEVLIVKLADNKHNYNRPNGTDKGRAKYEKSMMRIRGALDKFQ